MSRTIRARGIQKHCCLGTSGNPHCWNRDYFFEHSLSTSEHSQQMLHPCPDGSQEELRLAPCTIRASSNVSWHTGSQQPQGCSHSLMWTERARMKKFSLQPLLKNQTCGTWKVPEWGALLCHRSKARQQDTVPSSITRPPFHAWLAVCPCWLCLLLICALMPWHTSTEALYVCPRQLKINNRSWA